MDKEDILAQSRKENKDKDLFKLDIQNKSGIISSLVLVFLATILFIIQSVCGGGFNFALFALLVAYGATDFLVKYIYIRNNKYLFLSIGYSVATIIFILLHLQQIFK